MGAPFLSLTAAPPGRSQGGGPQTGHPIQPLLSHDSQEEPTHFFLMGSFSS